MVCFISNKELIRVSRKTIIAGRRQMVGELNRERPKIKSMNFPRFTCWPTLRVRVKEISY